MRVKSIQTVLIFAAFDVYLFGYPLFVVSLSGNWRWVQGWIFGLWFPLLYGSCLLWLYFKDPALLTERFRQPGSGGESPRDMLIFMLMKLVGLAWYILPPLDIHYRWLPRLPIWFEFCGALMLIIGSFFMFRAFTDNTFASPLVRIQTERKQHVIDTGVYGIVRHPMYLGATLVFVGAPMLINSLLGLLTGLALFLLLFIRIFGEEKLLTTDLVGYDAYRQKVPYRLLPHIW